MTTPNRMFSLQISYSCTIWAFTGYHLFSVEYAGKNFSHYRSCKKDCIWNRRSSKCKTVRDRSCHLIRYGMSYVSDHEPGCHHSFQPSGSRTDRSLVSENCFEFPNGILLADLFCRTCSAKNFCLHIRQKINDIP